MLKRMSVLVTVTMVTVLYLLSIDFTTPSESNCIVLYLPEYDSHIYQVERPGYRLIDKKIVVRSRSKFFVSGIFSRPSQGPVQRHV